MFKYILSLILLTGCSDKLTEKEKIYLRDVAKTYCSCRGGIKAIKFYMYLKEGLAMCHEGGYKIFDLNSEYYYKECKND